MSDILSFEPGDQISKYGPEYSEERLSRKVDEIVDLMLSMKPLMDKLRSTNKVFKKMWEIAKNTHILSVESNGWHYKRLTSHDLKELFKKTLLDPKLSPEDILEQLIKIEEMLVSEREGFEKEIAVLEGEEYRKSRYQGK